jgi:tetratricopeptide (TPR) repeat protein
MTDALIAELAQISALRVISRTSAMMYKGARKPLSEIARDLNVDAVVEGSVTRSVSRVRIAAQLIKAAPEQHLWAKSYEDDLKDILALQREVAGAIAREIKVKLTPQEQERLARAREVNPEAHEAFLKGWFFIHKWTEADTRRGISYFEQGIEIDPSYALSYAGLARAYFYLIRFRWTSPKEGYPRVKAEATKALEIDEMLAEPHVTLASVNLAYDWDWESAERQSKWAIDLNPGYADAHTVYAVYLSAIGRHDEALKEITLAKELDPLSISILQWAGWVLYHARQFDRMIALAQEVINMVPNFGRAHVALGYGLLMRTKYEEAIEACRKAHELIGDNETKATLAVAYAFSGKTDEAKGLLDELEVLSKHEVVSLWDMAKAYIALGDTDRAFESLEKACESRSPHLCCLQVDPMLDPLRLDPRFAALLKKVGFLP